MPEHKAQMVDLRSDTVTQPTEGMRAAMAEALVGDDVFGEDPTVNELQHRVAEMVGMEAALFVPSGTMANLLAIVAQTRPGQSIILSEDAHPYSHEAGNVAAVGGLLTRTVKGELGVLTAEQIAPHIVARTPDHHHAESTLISLENTTNRGAGNMYTLEGLEEIAALAHKNNMKMHLDGARLFHAVVASGISPKEYAQHMDTVSICFSKGLGAPVGSIVAGPADTINEAHRLRKMLGGGMRQAGVLAAAALYALDHNVDRLAEDHRRARAFREALEQIDGIAFPMPTPTNIVIFDVPDAKDYVRRAAEGDLLLFVVAPKRIRAVFHLDIDDAQLDHAIQVFQAL